MKARILLLPSFLVVLSFSLLTTASGQNNLPGPGRGTSCSCSNPEANCTASANCPNGQAFCACYGAGCTSYCIGNFREPSKEELQSVLLQAGDGSRLGDDLSRLSNRKITFVPSAKSDSSAVSGESLWEVLSALSRKGEVRVNGIEFGALERFRQSLLTGKSNFCARGVSAENFFAELSFLSGKQIRIISGDPAAKLTAPLKDVTFDDAIAQAAKLTGVKVQVE